MAANFTYRLPGRGRDRNSLRVPIVVIFSIVGVAFLSFLWTENDVSSLTKTFYILPWTFLSAACVLAPSAYLYYVGKFDFFHPLIFAAWTYVFPAFVVGSLLIAFGWVNPYFLSFIGDPEYNLPLTLVYISIGFVGLTVGYFLPVGQFFSRLIEPWLPKWHWEPEQVWVPGTLLLIIGIAFHALGFIVGLVGYQRNIDVNAFDGLIFSLLLFFGEGTLLLWLAVFSTKQRGFAYYSIVVMLLILVPIRLLAFGSRASLVVSLMSVVYCFVASGRKLRAHTTIIFAGAGLLAVLIGTTYGTTFRNIKGSEARMDAGDYVGQIAATIDYISSEDFTTIVEQNGEAIAGRVENLSSVAVVVANYEQLAPYEASYGLENNILNDFYTSFIPRFVWNDKPPTSDSRAYSDLYFNYGENSFAISPFADLLRNFGPIGVPLGMLVLGIYLRFIYATFVDTQSPEMWKKVAYFILITAVSYEAFYATLFPVAVRIFVIVFVSMWLVNLLAKRIRVLPGRA